MNRRAFIAGAGAVALSATSARPARARSIPRLRGGAFSEGVLSGDPTDRSITLATRLVGVEGPGGVGLELALDRAFRHVVARSELTTSPALGHAFKARVQGLDPHRTYYYRFAGKTAESPIGQFRTALPPGSRQPVQFGVFAGQDFAAGYFTAQSLLAEEDIDFVVNLGNYVVADAVSADVRQPAVNHPARTLADYRDLYSTYRSDPALRDLHASHAIVSTWDDGEVRTGYAGRGGSALQTAAYRAWFESMPHYPRRAGTAQLYAQPRFSNLVDLFVLDTRQERTHAVAHGRTGLLGADQDRFLRAGLKRSKAAWKLIASPAPIGADAENGWADFPAEREQVLATIDLRDVADAMFISAGRRRFFAANVEDHRGHSVAPEFGCGSVTQAALGSVAEGDDVDAQHGYAVVSAAADLLTVRYERLASVTTRSRAPGARSVYEIKRGRGLL